MPNFSKFPNFKEENSKSFKEIPREQLLVCAEKQASLIEAKLVNLSSGLTNMLGLPQMSLDELRENFSNDAASKGKGPIEANLEIKEQLKTEVENSEYVQLYIHCTDQCPDVCAFKCRYDTKKQSPNPKVRRINNQQYLDANLERISRLDSLGISGKKLSEIYFGGGTPSELETVTFDQYRLAFEAQGLIFTKDTEVTLELYPDSYEKMLAYCKEFRKIFHDCKVRFSIGGTGILSDDEYLTRLRRIHNGQQILETIQAAIDSAEDFGQPILVSTDMMFDLQGDRSPDSFMSDILKLRSEFGDRLNITGYGLEGEGNMKELIKRYVILRNLMLASGAAESPIGPMGAWFGHKPTSYIHTRWGDSNIPLIGIGGKNVYSTYSNMRVWDQLGDPQIYKYGPYLKIINQFHLSGEIFLDDNTPEIIKEIVEFLVNNKIGKVKYSKDKGSYYTIVVNDLSIVAGDAVRTLLRMALQAGKLDI